MRLDPNAVLLASEVRNARLVREFDSVNWGLVQLNAGLLDPKVFDHRVQLYRSISPVRCFL